MVKILEDQYYLSLSECSTSNCLRYSLKTTENSVKERRVVATLEFTLWSDETFHKHVSLKLSLAETAEVISVKDVKPAFKAALKRKRISDEGQISFEFDTGTLADILDKIINLQFYCNEIYSWFGLTF